jgi:hypothetical protein
LKVIGNPEQREVYRMAKPKVEKVRQIIESMERIIENGQSLARESMDREPSQRSQNNNWRYVKQDLMDLKKLLGLS